MVPECRPVLHILSAVDDPGFTTTGQITFAEIRSMDERLGNNVLIEEGPSKLEACSTFFICWSLRAPKRRTSGRSVIARAGVFFAKTPHSRVHPWMYAEVRRWEQDIELRNTLESQLPSRDSF
jgi:hypothetical protein